MARMIQRFSFVAGRFSGAGWSTTRTAVVAASLAALAACAQGSLGVGIGIGTGIGFGPVGVGVGATVPLLDPGIGNGEPGAGV